jgi:hypothetical protein
VIYGGVIISCGRTFMDIFTQAKIHAKHCIIGTKFLQRQNHAETKTRRTKIVQTHCHADVKRAKKHGKSVF